MTALQWMKSERTPELPKDDLRRLLYSEFLRNNVVDSGKWESIFKDIFDAWFRSSYKEPQALRAGNPIVRELVSHGAAQLERIVKERASIALMEIMQPNGKPLGECTFGELRTMGGTYAAMINRLAGKGRPRQKVKSVFTETELQYLYNTSGPMNASRGK
jgi:hypothetical protein